MMTRHSPLLSFFPVFLALGLITSGCRDDDPQPVCSPGDTQRCTCDATREGVSSCLDDGSGWSDCRCTASDGDADVDGDLDGGLDGDDERDADPDADPDPDPDPDLDPDRLHQDIEHLTDDALRDALHDRVTDHTSLGYDNARLTIFTELDVHGGLIECVYTGLTVAPDGTNSPGNFNTEHSWPRGDGADTEPAESDLHHLFPSDGDANNRRGSHPFGNTGCSGTECDWSQGGSELGAVDGGEVLVFEVRPETRGDIARAHFYFSVRYLLAIPDSEEGFLRAWHAEDPPSPYEQQRNDAIETYQHNRNPFIDRPDFVDRIGDF